MAFCPADNIVNIRLFLWLGEITVDNTKYRGLSVFQITAYYLGIFDTAQLYRKVHRKQAAGIH